ncbi:MAG: chromosome partitioning protein ParB [Deltaproteobacteria bacterium]|nr:MAG: chromosome partitioning protein ParB [Deltaproteobacteria bacterium]
MPPGKRPRLGRGLDAMLPAASASKGPRPEGFQCAVEDVHPNRDQPRSTFDDVKLEELAASIREIGILEPILVRTRKGGGYEIIAGERRWRAAQRAGLERVPIFVRDLSTTEGFEAALVENLQREDLNPIETARAFARLVDELGHTQESVATRVGKSRSTVANSLRLLKLPDDVLERVEDGRLSEGHGRALLTAPTVGAMQKLARQAVGSQWSVRETERHARAANNKSKKPKKDKKLQRSANVRDLETRLSHSLGSRVVLKDKKGKGRVEISYSSFDELDRLLDKLL